MKFIGKVVHGEKVGGPFGIATANIEVQNIPDLEPGVHIVEVNVNDVIEHGVMHFGERKTFGASFSIEVHILDFDADIYGKEIEIVPQKFLRPTQKFVNADLLFTQIEKDILMTQKYFLRKNLKTSWETFSPKKIRDGISDLIKKIDQKREFQNIQNILVYAPSSIEVPFVEPLMDLAPNKKYYFPKISGKKMRFYESRYKDLKRGKYNLLEPCEKMPEFDFSEPFLVFVPAQAVDHQKHRLGRGGGFYDRFLHEFCESVHKISVIPEFAYLESVPTENHDKQVDEVFVI